MIAALGLVWCGLIRDTSAATPPVGVGVAAFPIQTAHTRVLYAFAAYQPQSTLRAWSCTYCRDGTVGMKLIDYSYDSATDSVAYLGVNEAAREIVFAFRGTNSSSIQDWIDDIDFVLADFAFPGLSDVYVHSGFYKCYRAHKANLLPALLSLRARYPSFPVVLAGHSLGAAQATLAAVDLALNEQLHNLALTTFGSPRVGSPSFSDALAVLNDAGVLNAAYRVVHELDIVPHLPLQKMGFKHVRRWSSCSIKVKIYSSLILTQSSPVSHTI